MNNQTTTKANAFIKQYYHWAQEAADAAHLAVCACDAMNKDGFTAEDFLADYQEANPNSSIAESQDYCGFSIQEEGGALYAYAALVADNADAQAELAKLRYILAVNGISADIEMPELQAA